MKFHIGRISILRTAQRKLFEGEHKKSPIELLEELLPKNPKYIPQKKRGYIDLYFGDFKYTPDGKKLLSAKLGKSKETKFPDYDDKEVSFKDEVRETFPYVYILWDRDEQAILIQRNKSIFYRYEVVFNSIEDHFNDILSEYPLRVYIEPITEKYDFWKAIKLYRVIYSVSFNLHMPNFFGRTQKSVKEFLKAFEEKYNALGVQQRIYNPDGNIKISPENKEINDNVNWVGAGGGNWEIEGKKSEEHKTKVKITSRTEENLKTEEVEVELEHGDTETILNVLSALKPKYSYNNEEDEK